MALPVRRTRPRSGIERNAPLRCPGTLDLSDYLAALDARDDATDCTRTAP